MTKTDDKTLRVVDITPEEFKKRMQYILDTSRDPECDHLSADDLMCEVLCQLGYNDGVKIFDKIPKWYA